MKVFSTTWKNIRRSPYQALSACLALFLTFFAISVFTIGVVSLDRITRYYESIPQVSAFFKDTASQDDINQLISEIEARPEVEEVTFVSKKEAVEIYLGKFENDPIMTALVNEDTLPASIDVSTVSIDDLEPVAAALTKSASVDKVEFLKDAIGPLRTFTQGVRTAGIVVVTFLVLLSITINALIISFKISQKKQEIEIMRLLSATKWYIRWPFLFEGIFYCFVGTIFGWLLTSVLFVYFTPQLQVFFNNIPVFPLPFTFLIALLGGELIVAVILGSVSSFLAVLRYLK